MSHGGAGFVSLSSGGTELVSHGGAGFVSHGCTELGSHGGLVSGLTFNGCVVRSWRSLTVYGSS